MPRPISARCAIVLSVLAATISVSHAGRVVLFDDGRTLHVRDAVRQSDHAVLELHEGGKMAVPAGRIANWAELALPMPPEEVLPPAPVAPSEPVLWRTVAGSYADLIEEAALRYGLDPALLTAMAQTESAFNPAAVSPKGAAGLLQLMPATAQRFGVRDVFDVPQNVEAAAKYLKWLLERFEGRTELALAGYNAGEGTVERYQGIPPYRETRDYVARVLDGVRDMTRLAP